MYKKIICLFLAVVSFALCIIPAEAADLSDSEKLMFDLFTAASYTVFQDNESVGASENPRNYFAGASSTGFQWQVNGDYTFSYCYFTVNMFNKPKSMKVKFFLTDNWTEAELVGQDGNLYQYRVKCGRNASYIRVQADWTIYTGNMNIYSFVGIRDFSDQLENLDVVNRVWRARLDDSSPTGYYSEVATENRLYNVAVPYEFKKAYDVTGYNYLYTRFYVDIPPDMRNYDLVNELGFIIGTSDLGVDFTVQLLDSSGTIKHILTPFVSDSFSFNAISAGNFKYPMSYYQVVCDLSGYDLDDLTIRLEFSAEPVTASNTQEVVWYKIYNAYMTPYIEDLPWYKVFWNWLSRKWDSVTSSIKNTINSGIDKIVDKLAGGVQNAIDAEKNEAMDMGDGAVNNANDSIDQAVPNKSEGFMSAISTFTGSMSYSGTDAVLAIPALSLPEIPGLIPKTELMSDQELDLESFVEMLPDGLVLLVRSLLTIALIIYCFKELYDTIAYLLTLRKGDN